MKTIIEAILYPINYFSESEYFKKFENLVFSFAGMIITAFIVVIAIFGFHIYG